MRSKASPSWRRSPADPNGSRDRTPEPRRRQPSDRRCNLMTGRPGLGCRPLCTASRSYERPAQTDLASPDPLRARSSWRSGATLSSILRTIVLKTTMIRLLPMPFGLRPGCPRYRLASDGDRSPHGGWLCTSDRHRILSSGKTRYADCDVDQRALIWRSAIHSLIRLAGIRELWGDRFAPRRTDFHRAGITA